MNVSIIIPVYNGEDTLKLCLDAVSSLKIPEGWNIEVLLVNDGSTDRTGEIAERYPDLRVIDLEKNSGRIVARKTGAENAKYENILLIDSKIEVSSDNLMKAEQINYTPLMAGELNDDKYASDHDTLMYLIRRKFYKPYYPQKEYSEQLWIGKTNFERAPKGTGWLMLNKDVFLKSIPEIHEKDSSDDTGILKNIVFDQETRILRHTDISVKYHSRAGRNVIPWMNHRGKTFADHYLSSINLFSTAYFISAAVVIYMFISRPLTLMASAAILILLTSVYLCEAKRDYKPVIKQLLILGPVFIAGTIEKLFRKIVRK